MDSYLTVLSFGFIQKFDHFLPVLLGNSRPIPEDCKSRWPEKWRFSLPNLSW